MGEPEESGADVRNRKREVYFWPSQEASEVQAHLSRRRRVPANLHDQQAAPELLERK